MYQTQNECKDSKNNIKIPKTNRPRHWRTIYNNVAILIMILANFDSLFVPLFPYSKNFTQNNQKIEKVF